MCPNRNARMCQKKFAIRCPNKHVEISPGESIIYIQNIILLADTWNNYFFIVFFSNSRQECRKVPRQSCQNIPKEECKQIPRQKCQKIPKQECRQEPRQKCQNVPRQECKNVPKQECTKVAKEECTPFYLCEVCEQPTYFGRK